MNYLIHFNTNVTFFGYFAGNWFLLFGVKVKVNKDGSHNYAVFIYLLRIL